MGSSAGGNVQKNALKFQNNYISTCRNKLSHCRGNEGPLCRALDGALQQPGEVVGPKVTDLLPKDPSRSSPWKNSQMVCGNGQRQSRSYAVEIEEYLGRTKLLNRALDTGNMSVSSFIFSSSSIRIIHRGDDALKQIG